MGDTVCLKPATATHTIRVAIEDFVTKTVKYQMQQVPVSKMLAFGSQSNWVQIVGSVEKAQRKKEGAFCFKNCASFESKLRFCVVPLNKQVKKLTKNKLDLEEFEPNFKK